MHGSKKRRKVNAKPNERLSCLVAGDAISNTIVFEYFFDHDYVRDRFVCVVLRKLDTERFLGGVD